MRGAEPAGGEGSKVKERAPPNPIKSCAGTPRSQLERVGLGRWRESGVQSRETRVRVGRRERGRRIGESVGGWRAARRRVGRRPWKVGRYCDHAAARPWTNHAAVTTTAALTTRQIPRVADQEPIESPRGWPGSQPGLSGPVLVIPALRNNKGLRACSSFLGFCMKVCGALSVSRIV